MTYTAHQLSVSVPVTKNGKGWCVAWRERVGAPRIRRTFAEFDAACRFADETAVRIVNGTKRGLGMTDAQVAEYLTICRECGDTPPLSAVREWTSARRILGGLSLIEAASAHAAKNPTVATIPPTSTLVVDLITKLERRLNSRTYTRKLRADLLPFAEAFPNLREATTVAIEQWLAGLITRKSRTVAGCHRPAGCPVSSRRRDNVRDAITTLFSHAQDAGLLAPGTSAAGRVPKIDHGPAQVGIYSPEEMARIIGWFDTHEPDYLPWIVLGAFSGMRSSEVERLHWSALNWRGGVINITRFVAAKVKKGRKVPILPALRDWLAPWAHLTSGPVIPILGQTAIAHPARNLARRRDRMCADLGLAYWEPNALRHSYASYRRCTHTAAVVAEEMGSSVAMIKKHYDDQPAPDLATAYFESIRPEQPTPRRISKTNTMRTLPICYTAEMIRARRARIKSQTRRTMKISADYEDVSRFTFNGGLWFGDGICADGFACPKGEPGDRLWIQENHRLAIVDAKKRIVGVNYEADGRTAVIQLTDEEFALLQARTNPVPHHAYSKIIPGRFMYRSLSRDTDKITAVSVQRVQDITEEDAAAEGCSIGIKKTTYTPRHWSSEESFRAGYEILWEKIHGPGSWAANPWVWVISFKPVQ